MNINNCINYIEFPLVNNQNTKRFYSQVFGWTFIDWGPDYISFSGAGIDGGFNGTGEVQDKSPGALIVLYTDDLEQKVKDVINAGGKIAKKIYSFPGGRRFHFIDPNGNELAIWSE